MICNPCKAKNHDLCPSNLVSSNTISTGLSPEGNRIQLSGMCPCQHRVKLMSPITLEEAEAKIRSGLHQYCGCGARLVVARAEPEGEQANFVMLWFEDHSHEDLSKHGKLVTEKTQAMRAAAK